MYRTANPMYSETDCMSLERLLEMMSSSVTRITLVAFTGNGFVGLAL